ADFNGLFSAPPPYSIIAHSKGGLVTRQFYGQYSTTALGLALSDAVMLGTPNSGSDCFTSLGADIFNLSSCTVRQLNTTSSFRSLFTGLPGRVHVIAGTKDTGLARCPFVAAVSDGVVPADSVFAVQRGADSGAAKDL